MNSDQIIDDLKNKMIEDKVQYIYKLVHQEDSPYFIKGQKECPKGFQNKTSMFQSTNLDTELKKLCNNIHSVINEYISNRNFKINPIDIRNLWCAEFLNWLVQDIFNATMTVDIYSSIRKKRDYVLFFIDFKIFTPGIGRNMSMNDLLNNIYRQLNNFIETVLINTNRTKDIIIDKLKRNSPISQLTDTPLVMTTNEQQI